MTFSSEPASPDPADGVTLDQIDLTDASVWEQGAPHRWLDLLRREDPVHWHEESDGPGFWALTRHEDVRQVSIAPGIYSSYVGGPTRADLDEEGLERVRMIIIGMDPPEHRLFRNIVGKAFTPKAIATMQEALRVETRRVVRELRDQDRCEFVTDVAARIPMWSISELMGVPDADRYRLYELSHALIDDQDPEVAPTPETAAESLAEIFEYATAMAARERADPRENLTGALLAAEVDGRALTDLEFTLFFMFLIVAGNETTRTASSQGILALLEHPDQLRRLQADRGLIPGPSRRSCVGNRRSTTSGERPPSTRSWVAPPSPKATRSSCGTPDRTAIRPSSTPPTPSTSSGPRTPTCPSGSVSISASGPISPVCRCRSCSTSC